MMKLLTTKLNAEQAEIVFCFEILQKIVRFVDASKIEIIEESEADEFSVNGLVFFKYNDENNLWLCGYVEQTSSGNYYEPPDFDLIEVNTQDANQRLSEFCVESCRRILSDRFADYLSYEHEAMFDYQFRNRNLEDDIPF